MTNPSSADAPIIRLHFKQYASKPIIYPKFERVLEVASQEMAKVTSCVCHGPVLGSASLALVG